jgi:hypothetical protein
MMQHLTMPKCSANVICMAFNCVFSYINSINMNWEKDYHAKLVFFSKSTDGRQIDYPLLNLSLRIRTTIHVSPDKQLFFLLSVSFGDLKARDLSRILTELIKT